MNGMEVKRKKNVKICRGNLHFVPYTVLWGRNSQKMFQNTKKHAQSLILFRKSSEGAAEFVSPSMQLSVVCTLVTAISEVGSMPREGLPTDISVDRGCLPFTKNSRKFRLGCKWNTIFWLVPLENFRNERNFCVVTFSPLGRSRRNSCSI